METETTQESQLPEKGKFEKPETENVQVLSCSLQLKNLLKTNLKLLKINDMTNILSF